MEGAAVSAETPTQAPEAAAPEVADATHGAVAAREAAVASSKAPVLTVAPAWRETVSTLVPRATALGRLQDAAVQLVPRAHYWITRVGVAGQAGLAALTAAVIIGVSTLLPAHHALESLTADLARAQHLPGGPSLELSVPRLIASLPTRAQVPAVLGAVYEQAKAAGVALEKGRYTYTPPNAKALGRYDLEFPVKAGYPQIRTFIDRTLTAVPAAALTRLRVERKAVGDTAVNADVGFAVFVRNE
jgi:hypothetical protein